MRVRTRMLGGAAAVAALSAGGGLALASSGASAQSQSKTEKVIVVLDNQDAANPASRAHLASRVSTFRGAQKPVLAQLHRAHASGIQTYSVIDAIAATVRTSEVSRLKHDAAVKEVIPDALVPVGSSSSSAAQSAGVTSATSLHGSRSHSVRGGHAVRPHEVAGTGAVCSSNPNQPQLNPEGLSLIHANSQQPGAQTAASLGITGAGVKVAYIADGLNPNNPDFIRPDGQHVFIDYKDFTGLGTNTVTGGEEAFGDAASIAAQGDVTYNVAGYGPNGVQTPCYITIEGVAPGASLVGEDIFGANNAGYSSTILDAINYAVTTDHVNVLNESFGSNYYPDDTSDLDLIKLANDEAIAAGTTVTVSSGDAGATSTMGSPSTDPLVISSGATTSYRINLQDGYGGAQFPGVRGWTDDNISSFSSGGYDQQGQTVDTVAPGELNWSLCDTHNKIYQDCTNYAGKPTGFVPFGGTSESSPLTAGTAALVYQAYMKTHGVYPTPAVVKEIIASTSDDIGAPADQQGTGLIDAYKAVQAAESFKAPGSSGTPTGQALLKSSTQLNVVDDPGTPESLTDTVTNDGASTEHVAVSSRQLGAYTSISNETVTLSDATSPKTTNWSGVPANYQKITFQVPAGENRLDAAAAFQQGETDTTDPSLLARVRITLVDPQGDLSSYSVPQGDGNHTDVQVTNPRAGTWTAYVWSNEGASPYDGTTGPVVFGAAVARFTSFGSVSPSTLTLKPGQSAPVTLNLTTPSTPGDSAGSLVFTGAGSLGTSTVPVTVRSLIPSGNQSFQQSLVGGNGREVTVGQEFYYGLDVGPNKPELNASVLLADNPNNPFTAFLIGPNGESQAIASNALPNGGANAGVTNELGAQLHVLDPAQGEWTLEIAFAPTVSGTTLTEPFTVSTNESSVPASVTGLPTSGSVQLAADKPVTTNVTITNNGPSTEEYFLDARLNTTTTLPLTALTSASTVVPLTTSEPFPEYLVPTDTTGFSEQASTTGSEPIEFDSSSAFGDPDIESTSGIAATSTFGADPLAQGVWDIAPDVTGAYAGVKHIGTPGLPPAAQEPVNTGMSVTTAPFDPAVSSPTGDLWQASTNPAALDSLSPVIVGPGRTAQIPVTVTPSGKTGSTVSGTLYVDDADTVAFAAGGTPDGNQVAAIPYTYTIK